MGGFFGSPLFFFMYSESNCADSIRITEGEEFLAIADHVYPYLNPEYYTERKEGLSQKLPDLLSVKREGDKSYYRLREIKFKLEERLILKAKEQLQRGLEYLLLKDPTAEVDRMELVIALGSRKLKEAEKKFIGHSLGGMRYQLLLNSNPVFIEHIEVTLLFV